jgi:chromosome segregation ATPase
MFGPKTSKLPDEFSQRWSGVKDLVSEVKTHQQNRVPSKVWNKVENKSSQIARDVVETDKDITKVQNRKGKWWDVLGGWKKEQKADLYVLNKRQAASDLMQVALKAAKEVQGKSREMGRRAAEWSADLNHYTGAAQAAVEAFEQGKGDSKSLDTALAGLVQTLNALSQEVGVDKRLSSSLSGSVRRFKKTYGDRANEGRAADTVGGLTGVLTQESSSQVAMQSQAQKDIRELIIAQLNVDPAHRDEQLESFKAQAQTWSGLSSTASQVNEKTEAVSSSLDAYVAALDSRVRLPGEIARVQSELNAAQGQLGVAQGQYDIVRQDYDIRSYDLQVRYDSAYQELGHTQETIRVYRRKARHHEKAAERIEGAQRAAAKAAEAAKTAKVASTATTATATTANTSKTSDATRKVRPTKGRPNKPGTGKGRGKQSSLTAAEHRNLAQKYRRIARTQRRHAADLQMVLNGLSQDIQYITDRLHSAEAVLADAQRQVEGLNSEQASLQGELQATHDKIAALPSEIAATVDGLNQTLPSFNQQVAASDISDTHKATLTLATLAEFPLSATGLDVNAVIEAVNQQDSKRDWLEALSRALNSAGDQRAERTSDTAKHFSYSAENRTDELVAAKIEALSKAAA